MQAIQQEDLTLLHTVGDARRQRLFANAQAVPPIMWFTMLFIGLVTVTFTCFFRVPNLGAHIAMTAALAMVIAVMFVLIIRLDLPFRGDIHVPPTAFEHIGGAFTNETTR
jgi:hypothetical protein